MPASAWATEKAGELVQRNGTRCFVDMLAVARALDEAEARGASRLRERIREAAERHDAEADHHAGHDGLDFGMEPDRFEERTCRSIARVLRGLLEEEG